MSPRLPRFTAITICVFTFGVFLAELAVLLHQRAELQHLSASFRRVEEAQLRQLEQTIAKVNQVKKTEPKNN